MALKNTYTKVSVDRTIGEITSILARKGATQVLTEYGNGQAVSIQLQVDTRHGPFFYALPVNIYAVFDVLTNETRIQRAHPSERRAQAARVAWRIIKDWIDAQMALLETGMVEMEEVFLPYMLGPGAQTLYRALADGGFRALPGGGGIALPGGGESGPRPGEGL